MSTNPALLGPLHSQLVLFLMVAAGVYFLWRTAGHGVGSVSAAPHITGMSDFQYRNFSISESLSEETLAFTAQILRDGVVVGTVSNDGRGGADMWRFANRNDRIAFEEAAVAAHPQAHGRFDAQEMFSATLFETAMTTLLGSPA